jgi:type II secretory pathway predicted ATPase ExeA
MSDRDLLALYGLKYNPFLPAIPPDDLWTPPGAESFFLRVEDLVMDGGFALISGDPGLGKSKVLQLLASRLEQVGDVVVGVMERPQSTLADFYRELGELFGIELTPANKYGGFKALRVKWRDHIKTTLFRPVLLIDEAQVVPTDTLNELRLLSSAHFDSESLLTTVLCGDTTLPDRFRHKSLLALGSRARTRLVLDAFRREVLLDFLDHLLVRAGNPALVADSLRDVLVDHSGGNLRVLVGMAADLLDAAARQQAKQLDEKLFIEVFDRHLTARQHSGRSKRRTS